MKKYLYLLMMVLVGFGCKKVQDSNPIYTQNTQNTINNIPPVISVKNVTFPVMLNGTYTPESAVAIDDTDGDISSSIIIDKTKVDVTKVGNYTVTYTAKDKEGNVSTFTVNVVVIDISGTYNCKIVTDNNYEYVDEITISSTKNRAFVKKFAGYTDAKVNFDMNGNSIIIPSGEKYNCGPTTDKYDRTFTGSATFGYDFKTITFNYTAKITGETDEKGVITYTKK